jgi:hypothetical protein
MFVGKTKSLPMSGQHERCFTMVVSSITHNNYTMLEKYGRYKHSSL